MNLKNDYEDLTAEAATIKSKISLLYYFFELESIGTLRYDGKKGKEYCSGFGHQKTGSIIGLALYTAIIWVFSLIFLKLIMVHLSLSWETGLASSKVRK